MSFGLGPMAAAAAAHAVGPQGDDVADLAVLDPLEQFLPAPAVADHQAHADLEILLLGLLGQLEHLPRGRAVHGDRLLHEDVQALLDGVGEMHPAERRRRGEDGHVAGLQAIHGLLVAVEAEEPAFLRHVQPVGGLLAEVLVAALQRFSNTSAIATSLIGPSW